MSVNKEPHARYSKIMNLWYKVGLRKTVRKTVRKAAKQTKRHLSLDGQFKCMIQFGMHLIPSYPSLSFLIIAHHMLSVVGGTHHQPSLPPSTHNATPKTPLTIPSMIATQIHLKLILHPIGTTTTTTTPTPTTAD